MPISKFLFLLLSETSLQDLGKLYLGSITTKMSYWQLKRPLNMANLEVLKSLAGSHPVKTIINQQNKISCIFTACFRASFRNNLTNYSLIFSFTIPRFGCYLPLSEPTSIQKSNTCICCFRFLECYLCNSVRMSLKNIGYLLISECYPYLSSSPMPSKWMFPDRFIHQNYVQVPLNLWLLIQHTTQRKHESYRVLTY
jgi:hypothetical protein